MSAAPFLFVHESPISQRGHVRSLSKQVSDRNLQEINQMITTDNGLVSRTYFKAHPFLGKKKLFLKRIELQNIALTCH